MTARTILALAAFGLLGAGVLAAQAPAGPVGPEDVLRLKLRRGLADGESVRARLSVGLLPRGAKVVVRTPDGKIAGTVSPFGVRPGSKAGVYTIPVPASAVAGDEVVLRLRVLEKGAAADRRPTAAEIEGAEAVIMATPSPLRARCVTPAVDSRFCDARPFVGGVEHGPICLFSLRSARLEPVPQAMIQGACPAIGAPPPAPGEGCGSAPRPISWFHALRPACRGGAVDPTSPSSRSAPPTATGIPGSGWPPRSTTRRGSEGRAGAGPPR